MSEKATYGRIWLWGRRKGSLPEQTEDSVPQILREAKSVIVVPYAIWDIDFQQAYEPGRAELTSLFVLRALTTEAQKGGHHLKSCSYLCSDPALKPRSLALRACAIQLSLGVSRRLVPESLTETPKSIEVKYIYNGS